MEVTRLNVLFEVIGLLLKKKRKKELGVEISWIDITSSRYFDSGLIYK